MFYHTATWYRLREEGRKLRRDDVTFYEEENTSVHSGGKSRSAKEYTAFSATYKPDTNELLLDGGDTDVCYQFARPK